jgi:hypothetical protein
LSVGAYLATRDPVFGTVHQVLLALMALLPLAVARKHQPRHEVAAAHPASNERGRQLSSG